MSNIVGMAIPVTFDNAPKIAVVNGGQTVEVENDSFFIFPYDPELTCSLVPGYVFRENYRFASPRSTDHFVDIYEI